MPGNRIQGPDQDAVLRFMRKAMAECESASDPHPPRLSDLLNRTLRHLKAAGLITVPGLDSIDWFGSISHNPIWISLMQGYQHLVTLGYIVPAVMPQGVSLVFSQFCITERGREWIAGADPMPEDTTGYLAALSEDHRTHMNLRNLLNRLWIGLPLCGAGVLFLVQHLKPAWEVRSELFKGATYGVVVSATGGLIVYWLTRYMDRRARRYNALCSLEVTLKHLLTTLSDNQDQLDKAIKSNELTLIFPRPLRISEQDINEVGRAGLKNQLSGVLIDCEKYSQRELERWRIEDRKKLEAEMAETAAKDEARRGQTAS